MRRLSSILLVSCLLGCTTTTPAPDSGAPDAGPPIGNADAGSSDATAASDAGPPPDWRDCDPLVPTRCGLPFPSNLFTRADTTTPTGIRLDFRPGMMPQTRAGLIVSTESFNRMDGFSPAAFPMTHMPNATVAGLPTHATIADSLLPASPTIILDATSGERVAHWDELDMSYSNDAQRMLLLRPAIGLAPGHRYIVAIRGVKDAQGTALAPSDAFAALRDGTPSTIPGVEERRALYADIFAKLQTANVPKADLQLAWDFTVASRENVTGDLISMRDEALAALPAGGPAYTITRRLDLPTTGMNADPHIAFEIRGEMVVPDYTMPSPETTLDGVFLRRDANGRPMAVGTRRVKFWIEVPRSAAAAPAKVLQWGHGLLGSGEEVEYFDTPREWANRKNYILFALSLQGMSEDDVGNLLTIAGSGDIGRFREVTETLDQGLLNWMLAIRMIRGALANDPMMQIGGHSAVDVAAKPVYLGQSQGGIFGGTYMTVSPDIERGILLVPGQAYGLLLNRNVGGWTQFSPLFGNAYPNRLDIQRCLQLMQMLWDRSEPSGFTRYLNNDRFPGVPAKQVLIIAGINDHQVTNLGTHLMARTMGGVPNIAPVNRTIWGIPEVPRPHTGSAMIEVSFGVPDVPFTNNTPPADAPDPHQMIADPMWVLEAGSTFLESGTVNPACDGACDPM